MARQQPELGTKSPFRLRLGLNIDRFRGVNRESDPGAIRDDEFQDAVNIRLTPSGKVVPRGGQSKVNTSAMTGCVEGMIDDEQETIGGKIYAGVDNGVQTALTYNPYQDPAIGTVGDGTLGSPCGVFNGRAFFSGVNSGGVWTIKSVMRDGTIVAEFTVPNTYASFANQFGIEWNGALWLQTHELGVATRLYKWDGISLSLDDNLAGYHGAGGGRIVVERQGLLYYIAEQVAVGDAGVVRQRSAAGTWSTYTSFSGISGGAFLQHLINYNDVLYAQASSSPAVMYTVTASGVTLVNSVSGAIFQTWKVFDNYLYYLWWDPGLEIHMIGRFDGATWTDDYVTDPFPTNAPGGYTESFFVPYNGSLYAFSRQVGGTQAVVFRSDRNDVTTWTEMESSESELFGGGANAVA